MKKRIKHTFESVKQFVESQGYSLVSTEYKSNKEKLHMLCPNGHDYFPSFMNFLVGWRCKKCDVLNRTLSLDFIKKEIEKEDYILLSSEYNKNTDKLEIKCPKGHTYKTDWHSFNKGIRCPKCFGNDKLDYSEIKSFIESEGYKLHTLQSEYKSVRTRITLECPEGHIYTTLYNRFKRGQRCKKCFEESRKVGIEPAKQYVEQFNYEILSDKYKNAHSVMEFKCDKGHTYKTTYGRFKHGSRCPFCAKKTSKGEHEVYEFVRQFFTDAKQSDRSLINPFELDIVIPSKKTAIEYCGLYWHSEIAGQKDKNYHINKLKACTEKGYRLITIFEDEWTFKRKIVEERLKTILGVNDAKRVYARKCEIREIDNKSKNAFLDAFHVQGKDTSLVRVGAFYNNRLVSVMTFGKGSLAKQNVVKNNDWELNRFCSDSEFHVIGIASKLLSWFIKNYKPNNVWSYSDLRWSDGNLYKTLGFTYIHDCLPSYWYIKDEVKRIHRFNFRKGVLKNKLPIFDPNKTEFQNMIENGWDRCWDCGNQKWELNCK